MYFTPNFLLVAKNEDGFNSSDIFSVCSIGESTKQEGGGCIGNKGIGFKASFAASHSPTILSPPWFFKFAEGPDEIDCYVTPHWLDKPARESLPELVNMVQEEYRTCGSLLYLPYHSQMKAMISSKQFVASQHVDAASLLFLKKIKCIEVYGSDCERSEQSLKLSAQCEKVSDLEFMSNMASEFWVDRPKLSKHILDCLDSKTLVVTARVLLKLPKMSKEEKENVSEISICFPLQATSTFLNGYSVYAFLPVCKLGFPFKVHAEWSLSTNRESVNESISFNELLRDQCAFLVAACLTSGNFDDWISLIPEVNPTLNGWWSEFVHKIHAQIKYDVFEKCCPFRKAPHEQYLLIGSDSESLQLLEIVSASDLKLYGGFCVLTYQDFETYFSKVMGKISGLSADFESLSAIHLLKTLPNKEVNCPKAMEKFISRLNRPKISCWNKFFEILDKSKNCCAIDICASKPIFLVYNSNLDSERNFILSLQNVLIVKTEDISLLIYLRRIIKYEVKTIVGFASLPELNILKDHLNIDILDIHGAIVLICTFHIHYHLMIRCIPVQTQIVNQNTNFFEELEVIIDELVFLFENRHETEKILRSLVGDSSNTPNVLWIPVESALFSERQEHSNLVQIFSASDGRPVILQTVLGIACLNASSSSAPSIAAQFDSYSESSLRTDNQACYSLRHPLKNKLFRRNLDQWVPPENRYSSFTGLPQVQQTSELIKWECLLAWAGTQSPLPTLQHWQEGTRNVDLQMFLDNQIESESEFVFLIDFHSDEALRWFRTHLQHEVYLNEKLKSDDEFSFFCYIFPTIKLPEYLQPEQGRKLGIISEFRNENLDMILKIAIQQRDYLSNCLNFPMHRELLFAFLNHASDEICRLICDQPIFKSMDQASTLRCLSNIETTFIFETAECSNLFTKELQAVSLLRRNKMIELVEASSEAEQNFIRKHFHVAYEEFDTNLAVKLIVNRHLQILPEDGRSLLPVEIKDIQNELCFLFENQKITTQYLAQVTKDGNFQSESALIKQLWIPVCKEHCLSEKDDVSLRTLDNVQHIFVSSILSLSFDLSTSTSEYRALCYEVDSDQDQVQEHRQSLLLESALIWLGCSSPIVLTANMNSNSGLLSMKHFLSTIKGPEIVSLIKLHSKQALKWFCGRFEYARYLNKKLLGHSGMGYVISGCDRTQTTFSKDDSICMCLDSLFVDIPEGLDEISAAQISLHSSLNYEDINEILEFVLGCRTNRFGKIQHSTCLNPDCLYINLGSSATNHLSFHTLSRNQWVEFFNHLQNASISIICEAATKSIFNPASNARNVKNSHTQNKEKKQQHRIGLKDFKFETIFISNQTNDSEELMLGLYAFRHMLNPPFIIAESPEEYGFLERCLERSSSLHLALLNTEICTQFLIDQRHGLGANNREDLDLMCREIVYLFKNRELTLAFLQMKYFDPKVSQGKNDCDDEMLRNLLAKYQVALIPKWWLQQDPLLKQALQWLGHISIRERDSLQAVVVSSAVPNETKFRSFEPHERGPNHKSTLGGKKIGKDCRQDSHQDAVDSAVRRRESIAGSGRQGSSILENREHKAEIGRMAELFVYHELSRLYEKSGKSFPLENWVSSSSREFRIEAAIAEDSIDDSLGYDFVVESRVFFNIPYGKKEQCRIEVKGTECSYPLQFYLSSNELNVMRSGDCEYVVLIVSHVRDDGYGNSTGKLLGYIDCSKFVSCPEICSTVRTSDGLELIPLEYKIPFATCSHLLSNCFWFN